MQYGVYLPNFGPFSNARTISNLRQTRRRMRVGMASSYGITSHVLYKLPVIDPLDWLKCRSYCHPKDTHRSDGHASRPSSPMETRA